MPLYEYYCSSCEKDFEIIQKINDNIPDECPLCNSKEGLSKKISLSSFQLKGSGWYKDGYSSKKKELN